MPMYIQGAQRAVVVGNGVAVLNEVLGADFQADMLSTYDADRVLWHLLALCVGVDAQRVPVGTALAFFGFRLLWRKNTRYVTTAEYRRAVAQPPDIKIATLPWYGYGIGILITVSSLVRKRFHGQCPRP